uniref:Extensin family protein n=1 Tax=Rhodopseudomonas palustris (strain BisA53) TaxID=316055 RepID=Q07IF9_RHOP5
MRLEAVVLPDQSRVAVKPAAILRCAMASELASWVRSDMVPIAAGLGTKLAELDNFDSYECRGRNRVVGAKLSEHGRANAIDVRGVKLMNGQMISLTDRAVPRALREQVVGTVCARFATVLGPGSDWYHEDHIHLDLAPRRGGYKICQWNVWDPLPQVAPLLPAQRPEEAPPREVAEGAAKPGSAAPPAQASPEPSPEAAPIAEGEVGDAEAVQPPPAPKPAAKPKAKPKATRKHGEPRRL